MTAAATSQVDVGVVVVTYFSSSVIGGLLDSLDGGLSGLSWKVGVVDNGSTDGTVDIVGKRGIDILETNANLGYAAAINRGARRFADARSILVLNPDVTLTPGSVAAMFDVLQDDPEVGIVAPMTIIPGDPPRLDPTQRHEPSLASTWVTALLGPKVAARIPGCFEAVVDPSRYESPCDVDWAVGAVLLVGRKCADRLGDWDESYFLYSEETDFCRRARQAGFVVRYTPTAVVEHLSGAGLVDPRLRAMLSVNRVREYGRRHRRFATWWFLLGNVVHETTRGLAGRPAARASAAALIFPSRRPPEIDASDSLVPR